MVWPWPFTISTTPSGTPAAVRISLSTSAERDVSSAGLSTTLHPAVNLSDLLFRRGIVDTDSDRLLRHQMTRFPVTAAIVIA